MDAAIVNLKDIAKNGGVLSAEKVLGNPRIVKYPPTMERKLKSIGTIRSIRWEGDDLWCRCDYELRRGD